MRVGTSFKSWVSDCLLQDHPHACGDKKSVAQALLSVTGSSPCVWGQGVEAVNICRNPGIIPMRVGTSGSCQDRHRGRWDHPHACGDKKDTVNDTIRDEGSSPCVWGQVEALSVCDKTDRIIPMRVGTS